MNDAIVSTLIGAVGNDHGERLSYLPGMQSHLVSILWVLGGRASGSK